MHSFKISLFKFTYLLGFNSLFATILVNPSKLVAEASLRAICLKSMSGFDVDTPLLLDTHSLLPDFVSTKLEEARLVVMAAVQCDDTIDNLSPLTLFSFWAKMQP